MTDTIHADAATRAMCELVDDRVETVPGDDGRPDYRQAPSLLVVPHDSIRSSMGARSGRGGESGGTGGVNYRAFTLWSSIKGQARVGDPLRGRAAPQRPCALLQSVAVRADALCNEAQIETSVYEHLIASPARCAERNLDMLDPPRSAEITTPCSASGERDVTIDEERVGTLVTASRPGREPRAECRHCHVTCERASTSSAAAIRLAP